MEEKYCEKKDFRTPILPPIREGFPPPTACEGPPEEARVLGALPRLPRGVPRFCAVSRDNVQIVTELLVDKIDPPRFFPPVGPAQMHHCHWKCTVSYTEVVESAYPFPFRHSRPRMEVVYIDSDHLHLYVGPEKCPAPETRLAFTVANVKKEEVLLFTEGGEGRLDFVRKVPAGEAVDLQSAPGVRWVAVSTVQPDGQTFNPRRAGEIWLLRTHGGGTR
jgi:hypothetical protein